MLRTATQSSYQLLLLKHVASTFGHHKQHRSPLHHLTNAFRPNPRVAETIEPARHDTGWISDTKLEVETDRIEAELQDTKAEMTQDICLYSDGSGIQGRIGGAAVLRRKGVREETLRYELGPMKNHMVYEGEIIGMILAVELLRRTAGRIKSVSLGLDNMAAIQATAFRSGPGHHLIGAFHDNLRSALAKHRLTELTLRWTPGHVGIPGNEEADKEAKEAAKGNNSEAKFLPKTLRETKEGGAERSRQGACLLRSSNY